MDARMIELVFFDGCPNVEQAREILRVIPGVVSWTEWNLSRDVTGEAAPGGEGEAMSCRTHGAPSAEVIGRALERGAG